MVGNNVNFGVVIGQMGDNCTIYHNISESDELCQLLKDIHSYVEQADISAEKRDEAKRYLYSIQEEAEMNEPQKDRIKTACDGLKKIVTHPIFINLIDKLLSCFWTK